MTTDTFRRHTRACVDAAIHRVYHSLGRLPERASLFERLLDVVRQRSDLLAHPPTVRAKGYAFIAPRRRLPTKSLLGARLS